MVEPVAVAHYVVALLDGLKIVRISHYFVKADLLRKVTNFNWKVCQFVSKNRIYLVTLAFGWWFARLQRYSPR